METLRCYAQWNLNIRDELLNNLWKRNEFKDEIYHYTSIEALASIVQKKELWLSNCMFLNDKSEYTHIQDYFGKAIDYLKKNGMATDQILNFIDKIIARWQLSCASASENIFVLSLTSKRDHIPLWNIYSSGYGYNIGFDKNHIRKVTDSLWLNKSTNVINYIKPMEALKDILPDVEVATHIAPVIYNDDTKTRYLANFFHKISTQDLSSYDEIQIGLYDDFILDMLCMIATIYKKTDFNYEQEVRLVINIKSPDRDHIYFRSRNGILIPYIILRLDEITFKNLYKNSMIGPLNKSDIAQNSLEYLFKTHKLEPNVAQSEIKIR